MTGKLQFPALHSIILDFEFSSYKTTVIKIERTQKKNQFKRR